jgi:hypothetical protein
MTVVQRRATVPVLQNGVPDLGIGRDSDEDDGAGHEGRGSDKPQRQAAVESSLSRLRTQQNKAACEAKWVLCAGFTWIAVLILTAAVLITRGQAAPVRGGHRTR